MAIDDKPPSSDEHHDETIDARHQVQLAVVEVHDAFKGGGVREVRSALEAAIAARGLPEQPERWVQVTAEEIAAGRRVVVEAIAQVPEHERGGDENQNEDAEAGPEPAPDGRHRADEGKS